jgi:hypothetical protein
MVNLGKQNDLLVFVCGVWLSVFVVSHQPSPLTLKLSGTRTEYSVLRSASNKSRVSIDFFDYYSPVSHST